MQYRLVVLDNSIKVLLGSHIAHTIFTGPNPKGLACVSQGSSLFAYPSKQSKGSIQIFDLTSMVSALYLL